MRDHLRRSLVRTFVLACALLSLGAHADEVLGTKPAHIPGAPSSVPNEQAMTKRIWAPGIDDGYVPQGVTWADGALYLSSYRSTDPQVGRGPCRIYKVDAESGRTLGQFDLPADCGHAGGMATIAPGILVAADTRRLYKIDANAAFGAGGSTSAILATVRLAGDLKGSFTDFDGISLFVGTYDKDAKKSRGHFLPVSIFETHNGQSVTETQAIRAIALPVASQGVGFSRAGDMWVSASGSRFGALYRIDAASGDVLATHDMVIGVEDLAFDDAGRLWSVSEAGSLRWRAWSATYPVLFRLDPGQLR